MPRGSAGEMRIHGDVIEAIVAHAREMAPCECCGLLVGSEREIDTSVPMRNLELSPTRYRIDPAEHIALNRTLRGGPRQVVGAYHSHPVSAAEPSPSDLAEAAYPDFLYVIVSLANPSCPEVRGYRIQDGSSTEVRLVLLQ